MRTVTASGDERDAACPQPGGRGDPRPRGSAESAPPRREVTPLRRPYPTDVSDRQWRKVEPLLPPPNLSRGRPREVSRREVLSALCYRWATGCPWRLLPHDFPPWGTVYMYYREWLDAGALDAVRLQLRLSR